MSCPSGDSAGVIKDGKTCSELTSANYECYNATIESECCASCNAIVRSTTGNCNICLPLKRMNIFSREKTVPKLFLLLFRKRIYPKRKEFAPFEATLLKRVCSRRKEFAPPDGASSFLLEYTPLKKGIGVPDYKSKLQKLSPLQKWWCCFSFAICSLVSISLYLKLLLKSNWILAVLF